VGAWRVELTGDGAAGGERQLKLTGDGAAVGSRQLELTSDGTTAVAHPFGLVRIEVVPWVDASGAWGSRRRGAEEREMA
jgi:hypothetical protein